MSDATASCPGCQAPVSPESAFCTRCGAVLRMTVIEAPAEDGPRQWGGNRRTERTGRGAVAVSASAGGQHPGGVTALAERAGLAVAERAADPARPAAPALGPAFDGVTPAAVGRRVGAVVLDLLVVVLTGLGALLLTGSPVVGGLLLLEAAVALLLWEARSGRTVGNTLLGLRTAQQERPFAPGLGRATLRGFVLAVGNLVPVLGPVVLAATAGLDAARRQAWHDRAARCVVVDVRRMRVVDEDVPPAATSRAPVQVAPAEPVAPVESGPATAPVPVAVARVHAPAVPTPSAPEPVAAQATAAPVPATNLGAVADVPAPSAEPVPVTETPAPSPRSDDGVPHARSTVEVTPVIYVVTLDTGEAMSVSGPGVVGRRPQPPEGEPCDHVIAIEDPGRSLSRTHARFGIDGGVFWVEDRGSANGTAVVGTDGVVTELGPGERMVVTDGETVRLGERTFTVHRYA